MKGSAIQERLRAAPLLNHIERRQLRRFGHLTGWLLSPSWVKVFWAYPTRKRPQGRSRTYWRNLSAGLVFKWVNWRRWLVRGRHGLLCLCREAEKRLHRRREWMNINIIKTKQKICPLSSVACWWSLLLFVISLCMYLSFLFFFLSPCNRCLSIHEPVSAVSSLSPLSPSAY